MKSEGASLVRISLFYPQHVCTCHYAQRSVTFLEATATDLVHWQPSVACLQNFISSPSRSHTTRIKLGISVPSGWTQVHTNSSTHPTLHLQIRFTIRRQVPLVIRSLRKSEDKISGAEQEVDIWKHDFVELQTVRLCMHEVQRSTSFSPFNNQCQEHLKCRRMHQRE